MPILVEEMSPTFLRMFAFVFGAAWGSFFNVAIYRWPRDMSVVQPGSHCPSCGKPIPGHLNVPILGYLFLRGRTACCATRLSPRYPMIELLTAVLCTAVTEVFVVNAAPDTELIHAALQALCYFAFVGGLLIVTFVDLDEWIIPDEVSLPGAALGLATATFRDSPGVADCAVGAGLAFLMTQIPFVWGYEALTGRRGMGEGDPKLLLMIGAFLGLEGAIFALLAGSLQGLVFAGITLVSGGTLRQPEPDNAAAEPPPAEAVSAEATTTEATTTEGATTAEANAEAPIETGLPDAEADHVGRLKLPFGPLLSLAAIEYLFFGDQLVAQWIALFTPGG